MNHQVAVGVCNGITDLGKYLQPFRNSENSIIAICIQVDAINEFHHQIGLAIVAESCIPHARNVGMFERGQNMLLPVESLDEGRSCRVRRQDLQS